MARSALELAAAELEGAEEISLVRRPLEFRRKAALLDKRDAAQRRVTAIERLMPDKDDLNGGHWSLLHHRIELA